MSVAKAAVLGVLIAGWVGSSAQADPILVLGTFSNQPSSVVFSPSSISAPDPAGPSSSPSSLPLAVFNASAVSPALGVQSAPTPNAPPAASSFAPPPPPLYTPPQAPPIALPPSGVYDAFINLGGGPYPNAGSLTTGNAAPWFLSAPVQALYGGTPTPQQRTDFDNAVIQRVGQTFQQSGINLSLTGDPNAAAAHTISVVSNTANPTNGQAIGMTYIGGNGFHFIDQSAQSAQTVNQLEWIVAHNVSHELMLAFGVPENHDTTGHFIDARNADLSMMIDPNARFSSGAVQDLLSRNFQSNSSSPVLMGAQLLDAPLVPEPSTVALWVLAGSAFLLGKHLRSVSRGTLLD